MESWFLRKAEFTSHGSVRARNSFVEKGDNYEWMWFGYPDSVVERHKVYEANGKNLVRFGFSGDCIVTVTIKNEQGQNIVELKQENIPVDENPATNLYVGCGEGWTFYLANLKSILQGGIDLRNKDENLQRMINS